MRRLGRVLAVVAALLWSAVVWGGYALLIWTGRLVGDNLGVIALPADAQAMAEWARFLLMSFGVGTAAVLWLLGLGLIWLVLMLFNALTRTATPPPPPARR